MRIPIEISARHVHLSPADTEKLFGKGHRLTAQRSISQTGQFVCYERVRLKTARGEARAVGIIGPERKDTQVELAATDARFFGVKPPVRESGRVARTPGITVIGPQGRIRIKRGVILSLRHIHASTQDAKRRKLKHGQVVSVRVGGARDITFHNVLVRVHPSFRWRFHCDTDEGNAAGLRGNEKGEVIIEKNRR